MSSLSIGLGGRSSLSIEAEIPPSERRGVVASKVSMVVIVMVGTSPDRQEMVQRDGELIS